MLENRKYPSAADIARYAILQEFGGIYADADFIPADQTLPMHDKIPLVGALAIAEHTFRSFAGSKWFIFNGFLATPKAHPLFEAALDNLDRAFAVLPYATAWWVAGPGYLTALSSRGGINIFSPKIIGKIQKERTIDGAVLAAQKISARGGIIADWKPWLS